MDIPLLESTWAEAKLVNYYIRKRKGSHYVGNCWIIFHLLQELKKKNNTMFWNVVEPGNILWLHSTFSKGFHFIRNKHNCIPFL